MAKKQKFKMKKVHTGIKREKSVRDVGDKFWLLLNIFFTVAYLVWRVWRTIPVGMGTISMIAGITLLVVEILGLFEALIHYWNMFTYQKFDVPEVPAHELPDVDVFIATYNEPLELVYKTINGCKHMDYPDKGRVHIYVCDDGHRPEMKAMAEKAGVNYITRPDNAHAKAGNLNNALGLTSSPYILTLDADMIPMHNLLLRTVPFFVDQEIKNRGLEEKKQMHIGFVQSPQAFHNPDLFQFNLYSEHRIPNEQDYFYRDIQVARNRSNSVIYGGSNTVLSRMALNAIGGFFDKSITEDYGTGIAIQKAGFRCIAINEVLASGLSPTDLQSLVNQRIRWARGVINTNRIHHVLFSRKLSFAQKANYWASEFYWYSSIKRLVYFISPLLFGVFGFTVVKCTLPEVLLFWLPMYITSNIALRMFSRNIRSTKWTAVYETVLFPYMLVPVTMEFFGITMKTFKVTKKDGIENEAGKNGVYLIPFLLLIVLSVISIVRIIIMMMQSGSPGALVVLFWTVYNLYVLVMSCFFIMGRNYLRRHERVGLVLDCTMEVDGETFACQTRDMSETGVAVTIKDPVFIEEERRVVLQFATDRYSAKLQAKVVHVDKMKKEWKYAFSITDYCDTYDDYMQILYDRIPDLPQKLADNGSVFGDLNVNTIRRLQKPTYQNRRMPRVPMQVTVSGSDGIEYTMRDFNFRYCTLESPFNMPEELALNIDGIRLQCRLTKTFHVGKGLYEVINYQELYDDTAVRARLEKWTTEQWSEPAEDAQLPPAEEVKALEASADFDEMKGL